MFGYRQDTRSERERYLEDELERHREADRRRDDEDRKLREERRRETARQMDEAYRTADNWPEALRKQAHLFSREFDPTDPDQWFENGAAACVAALALWPEVEASRKAELDALQAQIAAIQEAIRLEVSERLLAEANDRPGWPSVADAIRTEDPERWLDW